MPWSNEDLDVIDRADVVHVITRRGDGTSRPAVPIWIVRVGDAAYVRSAFGASGGWYRHALEGPSTRLEFGGHGADVHLEPVGDEETRSAVASAYRAKYRSQPGSLATMLEEAAAETTTRLVRASD